MDKILIINTYGLNFHTLAGDIHEVDQLIQLDRSAKIVQHLKNKFSSVLFVGYVGPKHQFEL